MSVPFYRKQIRPLYHKMEGFKRDIGPKAMKMKTSLQFYRMGDRVHRLDLE